MTLLWALPQAFTVGLLDWLTGSGTIELFPGFGEISTSPGAFYGIFLTAGVGLGIAIAVILVAMGGYTMMNSGGDAKKLQDAREQIQNAIMGLLLILLSVAIARIVFGIIGVTGVIN